jgi:hypothetical protein
MEELWIAIRGYEGLYSVSNFGRIIRHKGPWCRTERYVAINNIGPSGYLYGTFSNRGRKANYFVHRLVAEHFIDNPEGKKFVNHKDGAKLNNKSDNLEWVTRSDNMQHAWNLGLIKTRRKGSGCPTALLTEADIPVIRKMLAEGRQWRRHSRIAKIFGVKPQVIKLIAYGKTWKHVPLDT